MVKTFCDLCGEEMRDNYAEQELKLSLFDSKSRHNVSGALKVTIPHPSRTSNHICKNCALRVAREGVTF